MQISELILWIITYILIATVWAFFLYKIRNAWLWVKAILLILEPWAAAVLSYLYMVILPDTPALAVFLLPLLWGDALIRFVWAVFYPLEKKNGIDLKRRAWILPIIASTIMFAYGTVNMQATKKTEHEFASDKLEQEYNIAFISDIHYGSAKLSRSIEKACERIAKENPDILIIGGDLIDEFSSVKDLEECLSCLSKINAKYGKYFVFGNHEYLIPEKSNDETVLSRSVLVKQLLEHGIVILDDETVKINNDLIIVGFDDITSAASERESLLRLSQDDERFMIALDHQPFQWEETVQVLCPDLQLSGHTHAEQVFGLRIPYLLSIKYTYGKHTMDNKSLIVSSGLGGWEYPFRTSRHCEYVMVRLYQK